MKRNWFKEKLVGLLWWSSSWGGPEVTASIPGQGTKIPHAMGQLSPHDATTEPVSSTAWELQLEKPMHHKWRNSMRCNDEPACHNEHPVQPNIYTSTYTYIPRLVSVLSILSLLLGNFYFLTLGLHKKGVLPHYWLRILLYLYFRVPSSRCCKLEARICVTFSPQSAWKVLNLLTFIRQEISHKNYLQLLLNNRQILAI